MDNVHRTLGVKTIIILIIFSSISFCCVSATNYTVGGTTGWDIVSNLQNWNSNTTYFTGDNLEFIYGPTHDVLEVNQGAYSQCQTSNPISTHNNGDTMILLDQPGTRYFICGTNGHCNLGLKLQVDVHLLSPNSTVPHTSRRRKPPRPPHHRPPPPKQHARSPPFESPHSPGPNQVSKSGFPYHITSLVLLPLIIMLFM